MSYRGVLGVDPGMTGTGLVACLVDPMQEASKQLLLVCSCAVTPPAKGDLYYRTSRLQTVLVEHLKQFGCLLHRAGYPWDSLEVAIEDPSEFTAIWRDGRPRNRAQTSGRLGVALGVCLAAVRCAGFAPEAVTCYPVRDWWPRAGAGNRYTSKADLLLGTRRVWRALDNASEHEVVAARLCWHHVLTQQRRRLSG